jgi:GTP pyrophosphokinase
MAKALPSNEDQKTIDEAVGHFTAQRHLFDGFAQSLLAYFTNDKALAPFIHFIKYRIKDPSDLRNKLLRKKQLGQQINAANLFDKVTDLAGVRIIHLHFTQMRDIHKAILAIFAEQQLRLFEEPTANCWDIEYENMFKSFDLKTQSRDAMYTSVHYVVQANQKTKVTCEVQVRTLMDEVWGEVSHKVNYPRQSTSHACQDQLKVLARLTSGCSRLVDSIFRSHLETPSPDRTGK